MIDDEKKEKEKKGIERGYKVKKSIKKMNGKGRNKIKKMGSKIGN